MVSVLTIFLLIISNSFMMLAWYGHLKFKELKWFENPGILAVILLTWGIALFEYMSSGAGKQNRISWLRRSF